MHRRKRASCKARLHVPWFSLSIAEGTANDGRPCYGIRRQISPQREEFMALTKGRQRHSDLYNYEQQNESESFHF
jgi:hypothetical protein